MQRRIQGAFFDAQDLVAPLVDVLRDVVAVHLSVAQSFQDEHVESVAQQIAGFGVFLSHCKGPAHKILRGVSGGFLLISMFFFGSW
jgi:glycerol-3-phosphate acyltransferase PlsY